MLKLSGAVLIILALGIWGVSKSERLRKRCDSLLLAISSLNLLETEIAFSQKDIASALSSVGNIENMPLFISVSENLENATVYEAFSDALKNSDMCFSKSDKDIFTEFSQNLGSLSKELQINSIINTKELFKASRLSAYEEYAKYGKLYRSMGFLLGILVAILLF